MSRVTNGARIPSPADGPVLRVQQQSRPGNESIIHSDRGFNCRDAFTCPPGQIRARPSLYSPVLAIYISLFALMYVSEHQKQGRLPERDQTTLAVALSGISSRNASITSPRRGSHSRWTVIRGIRRNEQARYSPNLDANCLFWRSRRVRSPASKSSILARRGYSHVIEHHAYHRRT